jgi:hypothetical protein
VKCIIAGSRTIRDYAIVAKAIADSGFEITIVVSGGAYGVDACGEEWASENGIPIMRFPAKWDAYGNAAGPIRNEQMAKYADALILVWDGSSRGSTSMRRLAQQHSLKIHEHIVNAQPSEE